MSVTIRLEPEIESQLERIAEQQGLTKSAWVRQLIEEAVTEAQPQQTPYELAQELGLIGCIEDGPADLAANAKQYIKDKIYQGQNVKDKLSAPRSC